MNSKGKIVKHAIIGMILNIVYFIALYFVAWRMSFAVLVWSTYLVPAAINSLVFWKAVNKWPGKKQLVLFAIMAVITITCYGVFSYIFESSAGYADYVEMNLNYYYVASELRERSSRRFFAVVPIVNIFLCNIAVQYFVNGTRREITKEEIDRIFDKYKK